MTMHDVDRVPAGVPTGGQFAASTRAEAGVMLMTEPSDGHGPDETCPGCPHTGATGHTDTALAAALRDASLPGTVEATGEDRVTYTSPEGYTYSVGMGMGGAWANADDVHAEVLRQSFNVRKPIRPEEAVDVLREVEEDAAGVRAFNDVLVAWTATDEDRRGHGWNDPDFDHYHGAVTFHGVRLHGFYARDPEFGHPSMYLDVDPGGDHQVRFTLVATPNGVQYYRGEKDRTPLTYWERDAVDNEVTNRLNRSGYVKSVGEILTDTTRRLKKQRSGARDETMGAA